MLMHTACRGSYRLLHYVPVFVQKQENMHLHTAATALHRHALMHARSEILQSGLIIFSSCSVSAGCSFVSIAVLI